MVRKRLGLGGVLLFTAGCLTWTVIHSTAPVRAAGEEAADLTSQYGFKKLELFKLQLRSANLIASDLNQDGRTDLILVDNSNSRLDYLQQRDKPAKPEQSTDTTGKVNAIENDWRFEHKKIAVDRAVATLSVGDFNNDGKKDLAYFSTPDTLNVRLQTSNGDWTTRKRFRISDAQSGQWMIAAGDLNSDKRDDIVVLGKHETYVLYQQANGELAPPTKVMNTTESIGLAQIADLDGDGRNDLCYLAPEDPERPFAARLQGKDGRLGAEIRCELPRPRGVTLADLDGKPGQELLAIEAQTGRVKAYQLQRPEVQAGELAGQLIQYGFGQQGVGRNRDLAVGDIDGDGLNDVVVTDPESAQMLVFRQQKGAGLDQGSTFPGLIGAEQVRIGDVTGDKQPEVVMLSTREKSIGISRMEGGRLSFPEAVPLKKEAVGLELADLDKDGQREIVYLAKEKTGTTSKFTLQSIKRTPQNEWVESDSIVSVNFKGTPERLMALDANHDGRVDFMIFGASGGTPALLLSNAEGKLTEVSGDSGFGLGSVSSGGFFLGQLDKPVILVSQNNFARNLELNAKNQWHVVDQYNAPDSEAKIVGAATINLDSEPGNEIVLVDQGVKKLRVLRREENVYRPWREIDIGPFPYKSTHVADLNSDGRDDLLLFGTGKFGVLYAGQTDPRLKQIASFESKLEKVHFNDLVVGDLNNDGKPDVAMIDTQSQFIEILNYSKDSGLRHALSFKTFEAKSIVGSEQAGSDPREAVIADVTGDGLPDLILLSHDRVLLYPQDDGKPDDIAK